MTAQRSLSTIRVLFIEKRVASEQNAPSYDQPEAGEVAEWSTKSPGAIWDAGTK